MTPLLWEAKVDIEVLTKTHLHDADVEGVPLTNYKNSDWHNGDPEEGRRKGGVLRVAKSWIHGGKVDKVWLLLLPLNCCSVAVRSEGACSTPVRLTGVCFTPSLDIAFSKVEMVSRPEHQTYLEETMLNHIVCGDFNPTKWDEEFVR